MGIFSNLSGISKSIQGKLAQFATAAQQAQQPSPPNGLSVNRPSTEFGDEMLQKRLDVDDSVYKVNPETQLDKKQPQWFTQKFQTEYDLENKLAANASEPTRKTSAQLDDESKLLDLHGKYVDKAHTNPEALVNEGPIGKNLTSTHELRDAVNQFKSVNTVSLDNLGYVVDEVMLNDVKLMDGIKDAASPSKKIKYSDKYQPSDVTRNMPNYAGGDRRDGYNMRSVSDNNELSKFEHAGEDYIPVYFHDLVNKKFIPFRAHISGLSESNSAEWESSKYIGRPDELYTYNGYSRTGGVSITCYAFSVDELLPMWQRINYMVGLCQPATYTGNLNGTATTGSNSIDDPQNAMGAFMVPPFVKMRIGDIYKNQPILLESVEVSIPDGVAWEIASNTSSGGTSKYEYLNGTIIREGALSAKYPIMAELSVSYKILPKRAPRTVIRHFGDASPENDSSLSASDSTPSGNDFNTELIKYNT